MEEETLFGNPAISLCLSQARRQQPLLARETLLRCPLPIRHGHKDVPLRFDLAVLENCAPERPLRPAAKVERTCSHQHTHRHTHVHADRQTDRRADTHIHTYTHTLTHARTHARTHTHTHAAHRRRAGGMFRTRTGTPELLYPPANTSPYRPYKVFEVRR